MCFVLLLYISFAEPIPSRVFAVGGLLVKLIFGGCGGRALREPPKITPQSGAVSIRYTCVGFTRGRSVCIIAVLPIGAVRRRLLAANSIRIFRDHPVVPHPFGGMAGCLFIKQALRLRLFKSRAGRSLPPRRPATHSRSKAVPAGCVPKTLKSCETVVGDLRFVRSLPRGTPPPVPRGRRNGASRAPRSGRSRDPCPRQGLCRRAAPA